MISQFRLDLQNVKKVSANYFNFQIKYIGWFFHIYFTIKNKKLLNIDKLKII